MHNNNEFRPQPANMNAARHAEIHFERMAVTIERRERETLEEVVSGLGAA